eukprot:CAMPEP_0171307778 /NCGR_PEP_ID=MMETSP0816-20121228/17824_1 /TAXON_ID=420281 /ORGANISM="Proboscia inermis, Strain CCAP1064/1" /LENGTH=44 /DNA_ID= /DNA_START= /DNA_END= /DNA_ORIENTATION=
MRNDYLTQVGRWNKNMCREYRNDAHLRDWKVLAFPMEWKGCCDG